MILHNQILPWWPGAYRYSVLGQTEDTSDMDLELEQRNMEDSFGRIDEGRLDFEEFDANINRLI